MQIHIVYFLYKSRIKFNFELNFEIDFGLQLIIFPIVIILYNIWLNYLSSILISH